MDKTIQISLAETSAARRKQKTYAGGTRDKREYTREADTVSKATRAKDRAWGLQSSHPWGSAVTWLQGGI